MAKSQSIIVRHFFSLNGILFNMHSFEGGIISAEVVKDTSNSEMAVKKHLGAIRYGDFIFETALIDELIEMIKKSWKGENLPFDGSLITTDYNFKAIYEDIFLDSILTETIIPQCDGTSKEPAFFRLRIKPASIRSQKGDGREIRPKSNRRKTMMKSNFRFELGSLPCSKVVTIDSFSVIVNAASDAQSNNRPVNRVFYSIDFPNLFVTISSIDLQPWLEWHKKFIIEGKNSQSDELSGRLVFLAPDLREELLAIRLHNVGIFSLQRNVNPADTISRFRVGLYCERIEIEN